MAALSLASDLAVGLPAFDELTHESPDHAAMSQELALAKLRDDIDGGLWPDVVRALAEELGAAGSPSGAPRSRFFHSQEVEVYEILFFRLEKRRWQKYLCTQRTATKISDRQCRGHRRSRNGGIAHR
jgi:hypothetical protein